MIPTDLERRFVTLLEEEGPMYTDELRCELALGRQAFHQLVRRLSIAVPLYEVPVDRVRSLYGLLGTGTKSALTGV
jgi:hypothetical protein